MGSLKVNRNCLNICAAAFLFLCIHSFVHATEGNHLLYQIHAGNFKNALTQYLEKSKDQNGHDYDFIEQVGLITLEQGFRTNDPELQIMALFGAGVSLNEKCLCILEEGLNVQNPNLNLIALNYLCLLNHSDANRQLMKTLSSNNLLIRLEALFKLAQKKHKNISGHINSLMQKTPSELHAIYPQIYAASGDPQSMRILKRMLSHQDEAVRREAVLSIAKTGRDDMLPHVRTLASHHNPSDQEAAAFALGVFKDEHSYPLLKKLSLSDKPNVRLASMQAIYELGRHETRNEVEKLALKGDLYAINLLGKMAGSETTLSILLKDLDNEVKLNAAISLLELKDPRSLLVLNNVIIQKRREITLSRKSSQGNALSYWKISCSPDPLALELTLKIRERLLIQAADLPENDFLTLAHNIFTERQDELAPTLIHLLEKLQTESTIKLLKIHQNQVGAPLIRNYCNLALIRLGEEGPYLEKLREWIQSESGTLICFRPIGTHEVSQDPFELTPEEKSRLLVESFETFALARDKEGIDTLIQAMIDGNPKNRYILAGLLMRATQ